MHDNLYRNVKLEKLAKWGVEEKEICRSRWKILIRYRYTETKKKGIDKIGFIPLVGGCAIYLPLSHLYRTRGKTALRPYISEQYCTKRRVAVPAFLSSSSAVSRVHSPFSPRATGPATFNVPTISQPGRHFNEKSYREFASRFVLYEIGYFFLYIFLFCVFKEKDGENKISSWKKLASPSRIRNYELWDLSGI